MKKSKVPPIEMKYFKNFTGKELKACPLYEGVLTRFQNALAYVAIQSKFGGDKHCEGDLAWRKHLSTDHLGSLTRHLINPETVDDESGMIHAVAIAWRALSNLEMTIMKINDRDLYDHIMSGKPESEYKGEKL